VTLESPTNHSRPRTLPRSLPPRIFALRSLHTPPIHSWIDKSWIRSKMNFTTRSGKILKIFMKLLKFSNWHISPCICLGTWWLALCIAPKNCIFTHGRPCASKTLAAMHTAGRVYSQSVTFLHTAGHVQVWHCRLYTRPALCIASFFAEMRRLVKCALHYQYLLYHRGYTLVIVSTFCSKLTHRHLDWA